MAQRRFAIPLLLILLTAVLAGCTGSAGEIFAQFNAAATTVAGGGGTGEEQPTPDPNTGVEQPTPIPPTAIPEPTATEVANERDLTTNPNALLVQAWGQTYALPTGTEFTIKATEDQVGNYVVQTLKAVWPANVQGGSAVVGSNQVRIDLALVADNGGFGRGTITFQPTLDAQGRLRLNPLGADFAGLTLPNGLTAAFGDAVFTAMTGAPNDGLSKVSLSLVTLDNGMMTVKGTVR